MVQPYSQQTSVLFRRTGKPRIVAGVCSGLARATNTDPLLYRVLFVMLSYFGGAGVLLYLIAWLFLPEDGEEMSPLMATLTGAHTKTNKTLVVVLGTMTLVILVVWVQLGPLNWVMLTLTVLGVAMLLRKAHREQEPPANSVGPAAPWPASLGSTASESAHREHDDPIARFAPHGPYSGPHSHSP